MSAVPRAILDRCPGSGKEAVHSDASYRLFCPVCCYAPPKLACRDYAILRPHTDRRPKDRR